jgi:hypothetical protein
VRQIQVEVLDHDKVAQLADALLRLAHQYIGQPVAIVSDGEGVSMGVIALLDLTEEDWFYRPVPISSLGRESVKTAPVK